MANADFSSWTPIQWDTQVEGREVIRSALYDAGTVRPMESDTLEIERYLGADVNMGETYTDDTHNGDTVILYSGVFNGKQPVSEKQVEDSAADVITALSFEWMNSFNLSVDTSSLGVSGARSSTPSDGRPFPSVYYTLGQSDSTAGYTGNANINVDTLLTGGYASLSETLALVEKNKFWNPANAAVIVHPALKDALRQIQTPGGNYIFVESSAGYPGGGGGLGNTLLDVPIFWSYGNQVAASNASTAALGNKLITFVNRKHFRRGDRIAPQVRFVPSAINTTSMSHTVLTRARQGAVLSVPQAAAILSVSDV